MCDNIYPAITTMEDGTICITFPSNRPYTKEIIDFMESKDYIMCGKRDIQSRGRCIEFNHKDLYFRPKR